MERQHHTRQQGHAEPQQAPGASGQQHPILSLQSQVGNALVSRLLAQRSEAGHQGPIGAEGGPVGADIAGRIDAARGGGSPLNDGVRASMEGALGDSFGDVRVHTGTEAEALSASMSAQAFTTGSDIFLGPGASASDTRLMAHELTHVVQQRSMSTGGPLEVGAADTAHEHQAEAAAAAVQRSLAANTPTAPSGR